VPRAESATMTLNCRVGYHVDVDHRVVMIWGAPRSMKTVGATTFLTQSTQRSQRFLGSSPRSLRPLRLTSFLHRPFNRFASLFSEQRAERTEVEHWD